MIHLVGFQRPLILYTDFEAFDFKVEYVPKKSMVSISHSRWHCH